MAHLLTHFHYTARGFDGRKLSGELAAYDQEEAARRLQEAGAYVVSVRPLRQKNSYLPARRIVISWQERIFLLHSWGMFMDLGLSLQTSLLRLRTRTETQSLLRAIDQIQRDIDSGTTLREALHKARIFPPLFVAILGIAEEQGDLVRPLKLLSRVAEETERLRRQLITMMIMPAFLMAAMGFWVALFLVKLLPSGIFLATYLKNLPFLWPALVAAWPIATEGLRWILGGLLLWVGVRFWRARSKRVTELFFLPDTASLPVIGPFLYQVRLLTIALGLQLQVDAGVSLARAFETLGNTLHNKRVRREFLQVYRKLQEGVPVPDAVAQLRMIPPVGQALLVAGYVSGTLSDMLALLVRRCQEDLLEEGRRFATLTQNIVILMAGTLMGLLVLLYFLLLFSSLGVFPQISPDPFSALLGNLL